MEYDGSIRIKYDVDTKEANSKILKAVNDAKKRVDNLRESIKALEEAGGKDSEIYQATVKELGKWEKELKKVSDEQKKAAESANYFKREIGRYKKVLSELEESGKYFGDEDYDKAYASLERLNALVKVYQKEVFSAKDSQGVFVQDIARLKTEIASMEREGIGLGNADYDQAIIDLQNLINKQKEYKNILMSQTDKEKDVRAQKEIAHQKKLQQAEDARRKKEESKINSILQKEEQKRAKEASALAAQEQEERRLGAIRVNAIAVDEQMIALLKRRKELVQQIRHMEAAGVGYGYKQYDNAQKELLEIDNAVQSYRGRTEEAFSEMSKLRKKFFSMFHRDVKKSSGLLKTLGSRLKGITLSLLVFNWITKGFNSMVSGIGKGFENLINYSQEYKDSIQSLNNANTQLGNSFAAALSPAIQAFIPNLISLVNWATNAVNTIGQLIAYLSGSKTWTKATQVTDDYKDSLQDTAVAAKKAYDSLANFDELNVLNKNETTGSGNGSSGNNMQFEEVPINNDVVVFGDKLKESFREAYEAIEPFRNALKNLWDNGLSKLGNFSIQGLKDLWEYFLRPLGTWAFGTEDAGFTRLINIIDNDLSRIPWEEINQNLQEFWIAIEPYAEEFGEGLLDFFEEISGLSTNIFIELFGDGGALTKLTDWLNDNDPESARDWGYSLGVLCTALLGFKALSFIASILSPIFKLIGLLSKFKIGTGLSVSIKEIGTAIGSWALINFPGIISGLSSFFGSLNPGMIGEIGIKLENLTRGTILDTTTWEGLPKKINDSINEVLEATIGKGIEAITQGIIYIIDKFFNYDFTLEWLNKSGEFFKQISEDFKNKDWLGIGKDIICGISAGITGALAFLVEPIMDLFTWVYNGIRNAFDSHSPARKMIPLGENILLGVVEGFTGKFSAFTKAIKQWFDDYVKPWFTKDRWDELLQSVPDAFKKAFQSAVDLVSNIINGLFGWFDEKFSNIKKGLSGLGGDSKKSEKSFSFFSVPDITTDIPALASGAVIRGGNPYLAWLGDQPAGQTNIEAPLSTIEDAVQNVFNKNSGASEINLTVNLDGNAVYKSVVKRDRMHVKQTGHSAFLF